MEKKFRIWFEQTHHHEWVGRAEDKLEAVEKARREYKVTAFPRASRLAPGVVVRIEEVPE